MSESFGLTNALNGYMRGREFSQQQAELQRQQQIRDQINAANAAGAQTLKQQQAEHDAQQQAALDAWTKGGKPAQEFKAQPFDREKAYISAMDARGNALADAGLMEEWTKNFAAAAPLREKVRTKTLDAAEQQYRLDGDLGKYAKTVYGTVHDGRDITDFSKDSTGGLGFKAASGKVNAGEDLPEDRYTVTFSDGHKVTKTTKEIQDLILSARDPAAMHKYEFEERLKQAAAAAEAKKEREKQKAQGEREVMVEGVKATNARGLEEFKQDRLDKRSAADNATSLQSANIHASASRYAADQGLKKSTEKPKDEVRDKENLLDTLAKAGIGEQDPITKQVRPGDLTDRAAARVNQFRRDGMELDEAVAKVKSEMRARGLLK